MQYNPYYPSWPPNNTCSTNYTRIVSSDETWEGMDPLGSPSSYEKLIVRNNSTLTINSADILMEDDGEIIVEDGSTLIIDNSIIRACDIQYRWQGILLENNSTIEIRNNSIIRDSRVILINKQNIGALTVGGLDFNDIWDENNYNFSSNLNILIDQTTFESCDFGVYISGDNNDVSINNSTFDNISYAHIISGNFGGITNLFNTDFTDCFPTLYYFRASKSNDIHKCEFENSGAVDFIISAQFGGKLNMKENKISNTPKGISLTDSDIDLYNGNKFLNVDHAVRATSSSPVFTNSRIGLNNTNPNQSNYAANSFINCKWPITIVGNNSLSGAQVINNYIESSDEIGIRVSGESLVSVKNNTIKDSYDGIFVSKTGASANEVNCNEFYWNDHQDLTIELRNEESVVYQNDFHVTNNLINIYYLKATLHNLQGTSNNPADNCFDSDSNFDMINEDSPADPFIYNHNNTSCYVPSNVTGSNFDAESTSSSGDYCNVYGIGSSYAFDPTPPNQLPDPEYPFEGLIPGLIDDEIDDARDALINAGGDDPYTYIDESIPNTEILPGVTYSATYLDNINTIYQLNNELDYWIRAAISYAIENNDFAYGEQKLIPFKKWRWQVMLVGMYIKEEQYSKALILLNTLPQNNDNEIAFVKAQKINIDRLEYGNNSITTNQIDTIYQIAIGETPSSGYAWTIYYYLTHISIPIDVPAFDTSRVREISEVPIENHISFAPNPTDGLLTLKKTSGSVSYKIINLSNIVLQKGMLDKEITTLSVEDLPAGVYILSCKMQNDTIINNRFIKI